MRIYQNLITVAIPLSAFIQSIVQKRYAINLSALLTPWNSINWPQLYGFFIFKKCKLIIESSQRVLGRIARVISKGEKARCCIARRRH